MTNRDFIGGEKPVNPAPASPPPPQTFAVAEKTPVVLVRYEATGIVFEAALSGSDITLENLRKLGAKLTDVIGLDNAIIDTTDVWQEGYDSGYDEGRWAAGYEDSLKDFDDAPRSSKTSRSVTL